jgi:RHS repeat-associated protein
VKKNAYGYHDVQLTTAVTGEDTTIIRDTPTSTTGKKKDVKTPEQLAADATLNQTSTIQKTYVIDYTSMYKDAIMETETNGLTYRYTFGLEKISAVLSPVDTSAGSIVQNGTVKLYYHRDRLGNTDYLTDNVQGKAVSYVDYDQWGNPLKKAVLKMGLREVDLVKDYTGHTYDPVLGKYYAKARLYDAESRRFMAVDPVKGSVISPITMNPYVYVMDNPLRYTDPTGMATDAGGGGGTPKHQGGGGSFTKAEVEAVSTNGQSTVAGPNSGSFDRQSCEMAVTLGKKMDESIKQGMFFIEGYGISSALIQHIFNDYGLVVLEENAIKYNAYIIAKYVDFTLSGANATDALLEQTPFSDGMNMEPFFNDWFYLSKHFNTSISIIDEERFSEIITRYDPELRHMYLEGNAAGPIVQAIMPLILGMGDYSKNYRPTAMELAGPSISSEGGSEALFDWKLIKGTQQVIEGTNVPKSFVINGLEVNGKNVWVGGNATKHMGEFITSANKVGGGLLSESEIMKSFMNAAKLASEQILKAGDNRLFVGGWEIGINGTTGAIYHALMK